MRQSYTSGFGYNLSRTSVLSAKGQTAEERARTAESLDRIGQAIMEGRTAGPRPFKDAAEREGLVKLRAFYEAEIAAGRKSCSIYLKPIVEQLEAYPEAAAPVLPNSQTPDEQLVPELETAPEGLDDYRIAQEIADYCAAVRSEVFRKTINDALRPMGWRVVRLPGHGRYDANGRWR